MSDFWKDLKFHTFIYGAIPAYSFLTSLYIIYRCYVQNIFKQWKDEYDFDSL
jgi:hypothetical protein